ncbi:glycoside hydrolase family 16 protein [Moniliophthora roreri]|nr:glycoside hydrolase family 16 protein [Moniliophthora roreri]
MPKQHRHHRPQPHHRQDTSVSQSLLSPESPPRHESNHHSVDRSPHVISSRRKPPPTYPQSLSASPAQYTHYYQQDGSTSVMRSRIPSPYSQASQSHSFGQPGRVEHLSASPTSSNLPTRTVSSSRRASTRNKLYPKGVQPGPRPWGLDFSRQEDPDDFLHTPDHKDNDQGDSIFSARGLANLGCLAIVAIGLFTLFAGYPLIAYFRRPEIPRLGVNATGQIPEFPGNWGLIDKDTPREAYRYTSLHHGGELQLVFSDEFNRDGRSFYPGDDPFWEAVDLHYWGTNNLEWYDPQAITTINGSLRITLSEKQTHGLNYEGGMIQTWNKFCFTGGLVVANVMLPGRSDVAGLWPAVWTMGNLGRAGYGATNDGMWPYSYDACDVGTLQNQTLNGLPEAATRDGDGEYGGVLSYAAGQRLSRCTCPGEPHPGPKHPDGSFVGRSAPEIDMIEAQVGTSFSPPGGRSSGEVSQSGQWAPFNYAYDWFDEGNLIINDPNITALNSYKGGIRQQATSCITKTNQACYSDMPNPCFSVYGFEYKPGGFHPSFPLATLILKLYLGYNDGYITWLTDNKQVGTILSAGMAADPRVEISARPVPQEPLYLIVNLGLSHGFGTVDLDNLVFPTSMYIDYIRVYQHPDEINIGCDPKDFPTTAYIEQYIEAYQNYNLTTWEDDYKQPKVKNRLVDQC